MADQGLDDSEQGDQTVVNEVSGTVEGSVVQAGTITGGMQTVHLHAHPSGDAVVYQVGRDLHVNWAFSSNNRAVKPAPASWSTPYLGAMVERREVMDALVALLIGPRNLLKTVVGVHGAGGFGKTVLARQVCERPEIASYYSALLWISLGEDTHGASLATRINDLVEQLSGDRPGLADPQQAGFRLGKALDDHAAPVLLVIDDVWQRRQLAPFLSGGANCKRLVTTRNRWLLPVNSGTLLIDRMQPDEATILLARGINDIPATSIADLLRLTGRWPVLLGIVNRTLERMTQRGMSSTAAAQSLIEQLVQSGPGALDVENAQERDEAVAATIGAGLDLLPPGARERYLELAIFAEDSEIPLNMLDLLWGATGGLSRAAVEKICSTLADLSLISDYSPDPGTVRLHDVLRSFLMQQIGPVRMSLLNAKLLDAAIRILGPVDIRNATTTVAPTRPWWLIPTSHKYLAEHLAEHLLAAGRSDELEALLQDLRWTYARIHRRGVSAIEADLAHINSPKINALARAIQQSSHLFDSVEPSHALGAILASRLGTVPAIADLVAPFNEDLPLPCLTNHWPMPDGPHPALRRTLALAGDNIGVTDIAIAPDGTWIATVDWFSGLRIWNPLTGELVQKLAPHESPSTVIDTVMDSVRVAPNGMWVATTEHIDNGQGIVRIWDLKTSTVRHTFTSHALLSYTENVQMVISPDSTWLALIDYDFDEELIAVRVWDAATGELRRSILDRDGWAQVIGVSPDGRWLATGDAPVNTCESCQVRIWDLSSGRLLRALNGHIGGVYQVEFAPDGSWLCTADLEWKVRIWGSDGELRHTFSGGDRSVRIYISSDGTWLATNGETGTVRIWDVVSGKQRYALTGHLGEVKLAISPDGTWLVTGDGDRTGDGVAAMVRIWDTQTGDVRQSMQGHIHRVGAVAISPDGTWLVSADGISTLDDDCDKIVRIWSAPTGERPNLVSSSANDVDVVALSPDGSWLASSGQDGAVSIWDIATGEQRMVIRVGNDVSAIEISPTGDWLATSNGGEIHLWDSTTGDLRLVLRGEERGRELLAIAPDGTWLATGAVATELADLDYRYSARIWDVATGQLRQVLTGHDGGVGAIAIAPDSTWLITGDANRVRGRDAAVRVWDVATGQLRQVLTGHDGGVGAIAIAPDSTWIVTGDAPMERTQECNGRIWNVVTGKENYSLAGHIGGVNAAAISSDGSWIATGDHAGTARIWDAATGVLRHALPCNALISDIAISSDDKWLAVCDGAGGIGTLRVWDPLTGAALAAMRVDGLIRRCYWLPDASGLCLIGIRGLYVFAWHPDEHSGIHR